MNKRRFSSSSPGERSPLREARQDLDLNFSANSIHRSRSSFAFRVKIEEEWRERKEELKALNSLQRRDASIRSERGGKIFRDEIHTCCLEFRTFSARVVEAYFDVTRYVDLIRRYLTGYRVRRN